MNDAELEQISQEVTIALRGRHFGRIFPLTKTSFAVDFHPHASSYLFIDLAPRSRRLYLIRRRLKELERNETNPDPFLLKLKSLLSNAELTNVSKERASVKFGFLTKDEGFLSLAIDLGGNRPNMFLLGEPGIIIAALHQWEESGQKIGNIHYAVEDKEALGIATVAMRDGRTLSEALDEYYRQKDAESEFQRLSTAARRKINSEIDKQKKLIKNLTGDLEKHGDAEKWKRFGDLLLANVSTARRDGEKIFLTDYFDENVPTIEVVGDEHKPLNEIAESYFRRYTKARNGAAVIAERIDKVNNDLAALVLRKQRIETAVTDGDDDYLRGLTIVKAPLSPIGSKKKKEVDFKGARLFLSSDGFEILVGKKAKDNDYLSFRVAKSLDLWLHAADYPGSHVIIRNPNRKDIPNKTLLEAAQLAAFYSSGRGQIKAAVNYTPKKFVNKPKRSAPGLVSLASFKTILVVPQVSVELDSD